MKISTQILADCATSETKSEGTSQSRQLRACLEVASLQYARLVHLELRKWRPGQGAQISLFLQAAPELRIRPGRLAIELGITTAELRSYTQGKTPCPESLQPHVIDVLMRLLSGRLADASKWAAEYERQRAASQRVSRCEVSPADACDAADMEEAKGDSAAAGDQQAQL